MPAGEFFFAIARGRRSTGRADLVYSSVVGWVRPDHDQKSHNHPSYLTLQKANAAAAAFREHRPDFDVWVIKPEEY